MGPSNLWVAARINVNMQVNRYIKLTIGLAILGLGATLPNHAQQLHAGPINIAPSNSICGETLANAPPRVEAARRSNLTFGGLQWSCVPPYEIPTYTKPADDSVVTGALLEVGGYSGAYDTGWVGAAAGNFCSGAEKQIVLVQNHGANFSTLLGPTPHLNLLGGGYGSLNSNSADPWRAIVAGNLDGAAHDEFVAVRQINSNSVPDLVVGKLSEDCFQPLVVASATIGDAVNSNWVGAAVGDFDGTGKKRIAMLKPEHSNLFLVELNQGALQIVTRGDLSVSGSGTWKALAAGDIDHDGKDELIAVRQVSDGHSPTVIAFKWNGSEFTVFGTATVGANGNSNWVAATTGDFNGDGRKAIVLLSNASPNVTILDAPPGTAQLRVLRESTLEPGGTWSGLAASDWLGGDQGADELILSRAVNGTYRENVFVYGDPFHRVSRDSAIDGAKITYDELANLPSGYLTYSTDQLKQWLRETHSDTFNWLLQHPGDYTNLVQFLTATRNWGVDGKQLRVWVSLNPPRAAALNGPGDTCSIPEDTSKTTPPLTSWNALGYFNLPANPSSAEIVGACENMIAWAQVLGRLAQDFPQLVAAGVEDFSLNLPYPDPSKVPTIPFTSDYIAEMEAAMRSQAPWLSFVPTVYYPLTSYTQKNWADFGLTLDSMLFYFKNEKQGIGLCARSGCPWPTSQRGAGCLAGNCAEPGAENVVGEIDDMRALMASGRKLHLGIYFAGHSEFGEPTSRFDYDLARIAINLPNKVYGAQVYVTETPPASGTCDANFLSNKFCTVQKAFFDPPQQVSLMVLNPSGTEAFSNPAGYTTPDGIRHVIYCGKDAHVHEIWWPVTGSVGQGDLTPHGPIASGNPVAYYNPDDNTQNVDYVGGDGHVHQLWWTGSGAVGQGDITPEGPNAVGDLTAYQLADHTQHVIYRGIDAHLHEIWWTGSSAAAVGDLAPNGPNAAGDPSGYFILADQSQHVIYRSADKHLHEIWWIGSGAKGQGDLTPGGGLAAGDPTAYFAADGENHVIFEATNGYSQRLYWQGSVAPTERALVIPNVPEPVNSWVKAATAVQELSKPAAFYVPSDGTEHVVYVGADSHLHELIWAGTGIVTHNDLTQLAGAPLPVGDPFAYYSAMDKICYVIYRNTSGQLDVLHWKR